MDAKGDVLGMQNAVFEVGFMQKQGLSLCKTQFWLEQKGVFVEQKGDKVEQKGFFVEQKRVLAERMRIFVERMQVWGQMHSSPRGDS